MTTKREVSGRLVATLADRELPAGEQQIHWDGRSAIGANAGAGLYWIRVRAGAQHDTQRIVRFR